MYRHLELTLWIGLMLGASYIDFRHRMVPDWLNLCIAACPCWGCGAEHWQGFCAPSLFFLQQGAGEESVAGTSSLWQHAVCTWECMAD